jgi:protein gp37
MGSARRAQAHQRGELEAAAALGKAAKAAGTRPRVFCSSLADVFDNQVNQSWRIDLFDLIGETEHLDWLLLTKRPENIAKMLPTNWNVEDFSNVWLGTTCEDQANYDRRWPILRASRRPSISSATSPRSGRSNCTTARINPIG